MEPKPVSHTDPPAYPTRAELKADGLLLEEALPQGWKLGRGFLGALTVFMAANLTGCGSTSTADRETFRTPPRVVLEASSWIESIFADSSGVVYLGCIAIMPPAVFPEDEAMGIFSGGTAE